MKIAISTVHSGKNPAGLSPDASKAWWRWYNGTFHNVELTAGELADMVSRGYGYTTQHANKWRHSDNFICGSHIALDFDEKLPAGYTLAQLQTSNDFILNHAAILHTTASHSPEKTKARVIFELDRPIYNPEKYGLLAASLMHYFGGEVDPKVKDPSRLFFGAKGCEYLLPGNVLSLETAAAVLVKPYLASEEEKAHRAREAAANRVIVAAGDVPARLLEGKADYLLGKVQTAADGEKYYTLRDMARTFGGYIAGGYYPAGDVTNWLQNAIAANPNRVKDLKHAFATIDEGLAYGRLHPLQIEVNGCQEEPEPLIVPDTSWRQAAVSTRQQELEALINEIEPIEPAFLPAVAEYYRLHSMEPPADVLEMIASGY